MASNAVISKLQSITPAYPCPSISLCLPRKPENPDGESRFNLAALVLYGIARDGSAGILGGCQEVMSRSGYPVKDRATVYLSVGRSTKAVVQDADELLAQMDRIEAERRRSLE